MKPTKIVANSFVLTLLNISSIILSFGIYTFLLKDFDQLPTQSLLACFINIAGFTLWGYISAKFFRKSFIGRRYYLAWTFLISFIWVPVIFVPLHYVTQGYITSGDNLLAVWLFQIPTNLLTLYIYYKILIQRVLV